ncbi:MAG: Ig-like domain-containing protein [Bacilli bacterium]
MFKKKISFPVLSLIALLSLGSLVGCGDKDVPPAPEPDTKDTYDVSFYVDGVLYGEKQVVEAGSKVEKPVDPSRVDDDDYTYTFNGWYENGAEVAWDFDVNTVNSDVNLFAEFDEVAKVYDLIVYVLGGSDTSVYITEDEIERVETTFDAKHEGKTTLFKFFPSMKNDAFNAKILSVKNKPDVIISGSKMDSGTNPLTLKESQPKAKVGTGWFTSTTRYIGVNDACDAEHLDLAIALYNDLLALGPDYFTVNTETLSVYMGDTETVTATLPDWDSRVPTFTVADTTIATVNENGVVTGAAIGQTVLNVTVGLVTIEIAVNVVELIDYDLVVWVYGVNGATTPSTYITETESNLLKEKFLELENAQNKEIKWVYSTGLTNDEFNEAVNNAKPKVDVVVSGNKLNNGDEVSIECNATYGKVKVGAGWFDNTSRYTAITNYCTDNLSLAIELYELVSSTGPNFEGVELDKTSVSLVKGNETTLVATAYGPVTWTTSDDTVATVTAGVVTAVDAGTATITATAADGLTATCTITVTNESVEDPYDLTVCVYLAASKTTYITEDEYTAIKDAFTAEGAAGNGKNIYWITYSGGNQAALGAYITEQVNAGHTPDVVIGRSGISSGSVTGLKIDSDTYKSIDSSWTSAGSNYIAINSAANAKHIELATALITLLNSVKA